MLAFAGWLFKAILGQITKGVTTIWERSMIFKRVARGAVAEKQLTDLQEELDDVAIAKNAARDPASIDPERLRTDPRNEFGKGTSETNGFGAGQGSL